ncbi:MAG: TorF family putative porin [Piscinibacter sp.]|uniref:TorF family putative porin n=1 Tax=Piscinibacter TaxID=1114981 RepID=UPI000FDECE82|nr:MULTISPECIES: TorF family putative porin [Piscinibacter]MCW5667808.1 TorF family putative porin [Piscinibacter sp.]
MKRLLLALSALAFGISPAFADDGLTANVSLVTKYKYRGQDQSDTTKQAVPAIQGGFDYTLGGFYLGNWNSSIGFANGTEMDFYGGYKGEIAKDLGYDVGLLQYYYPGSGSSAANTTELYGGISWSFLSAKYYHVVSKDYFGLGDATGTDVKGRNTGYLDLSANYPIVEGLTLNAHVGFTRLNGDLKDANPGVYVNYTDYKLGATYDLGKGLSVAGAVVGATKKDAWGDANKARLIVSLSKAM